jgi:hypothetical protein
MLTTLTMSGYEGAYNQLVEALRELRDKYYQDPIRVAQQAALTLSLEGERRTVSATLPATRPSQPPGAPSRSATARPTLRGRPDFGGHLILRRVPLDSAGYDQNGTYFGRGAPLYWFADDHGTIDEMIRALDREDAKNKILRQYPNARFYR